MITNISLTTVWVRDLDAALAFYTDVLGLELREDVRLGEDFRWLTVGHPSQPELAVHLSTPSSLTSDDLAGSIQRAQAEGHLPAIGLAVDDCRATVADLQAKGVEVLQEPSERPYGIEAVIRDVSGNWLVLVEHQEFDPEAMTRADVD